MFLTLCKGKIHRATVTEANVDYVGSITIDAELLAASGILPHERVQIVNLNNSSRIETYVIAGEAGSGVICMNGPASYHAAPGDVIIIIAYALMTPEEAREWHPTLVFVDEHNAITHVSRAEHPASTE